MKFLPTTRYSFPKKEQSRKNKTVKSKATSLLCLSLLTFGLIGTQQSSADVILHAFNWTYDKVKNKANEIKNIGYKKVLVAPPLKSGPNCQWWARYQPQDIRVIDHCLGNKESFVSMVNTLKNKGIDVYADIVLNHMANERNNSTYFPGDDALNDYASNSSYWAKQKLFGNLNDGLFSPWDFHPEGCISNWSDYWQVTNWRICGGNGDRGLPDLDPNNWVRQNQKNYLTALKNLGVKGFRIDAAKHMTNWHINNVFTNSISSGLHLFGEVITAGGAGTAEYDNFLKPYLDGTGHDAYDFPLLNTLRNSLQPGGSMNSLVDPAAYGQALPGNKAVTMSITHDIPTNAGFRYLIMDPQDEHLANSYLLGRADGIPMILDDGTCSDGCRWKDDYKQNNIKGMVKFHNKVSGQGQEVLHHDDCSIVFRRGKLGLVGINKCGSSKWVGVPTSGKFDWHRNYRDAIDGGVIQFTSSTAWVEIPARASRMWYRD